MANGSIDNLNFKILLDDAEFKAKVNSSIADAKRLNAALTSAFNTKSSNANLATTNGELEKVSVKAQKASKSASSLSRAWLGFTAVFWSVVSVVRIFTRAIGSAIRNISNFQQANANLATIMQVSRKEIEVLTNDALMLGRTTEWTASQVTELQTALAKLGYTIPQIHNMQDSVLQFATSVGAKLPEAAELAGASLRMFGMHSSEMQKALEILTASTNKTALDFEKLKTSLPYAGSVAHSIGFDIAETASLLGVLANSGLNASRIGTGLRQILIELSKTNGKLQTAMGGNIKTFDDFVNGLQHLRDRGFEAGEAAKLVSTRASNALLILANGVDDIRRLNDEVRNTDGLLKNIQRDRLDTLHGATLLLKSAWEGLIQTFRDSAGPMKDVVDGLTSIVRALSLASSRANRVAQGTKNVMGSDELTRRFKFQFEELLKNGTPVEEAAKIVQDSMQKWLNGAFGDLADAQHKGYKESGINRALYGNPITHFFVSRKMDRGRAANEQVEAVENAMDAVTAYMANRAKEEADIAANNYLEEWKLIFDTEGEKAARAAMDAVTGYENIKSRMEAYMAEGGDEGARERSKAERDAAARAAEDARRKEIKDIENRIGLLRTIKDAYDDLAKVGKTGEEAQGILLKFFPNFADVIKTSDFDQAITDALEKLKALDPEAYESLSLAIGKEGFAGALKALVEAGKDSKELTKLNLSSFWAQLEQLTSADNLKRIWDFYNATSNLYGLVTSGKIGTLVKTDDGRPKGYNITKTEARNAGVDEGLVAQIFGDKEEIYATTEEIEKLRKKANALMTLGGKGDGLKVIQNFFKSVSEYSKAKAGGKDGLDEMLKNVKANAVDAANAIGSIGKKLDEITGIPLGEWIGGAASIVANIAEGNFVQGAFQIIDLIQGIVGYFKELKEEYLELQATIADAMREYRYSLEDNEMGGFATIFGDNSYESFRKAAKYVDEYEKRIDEWQAKLQGASKKYNTNGWWMTLMGAPGLATALDFTKVSGISADTRNGWQKFWGTNKSGIVSLDEYMGGEWTQEKLKAYYDSYSDYLSTDHKALVEGMMEDWDRYEEYLQKETEYYKSIVGDVASEIADAWIEAFESAGDAATDFGKVMSNVADTIAKDLLTSLALSGLEDVLGEDYKKFTSLMHEGKTKDAMELLNQALQYVSTAMPDAANEILAWRDQYHQYEDEDNSANSLSNGIKSITEDTANLLAAYINGIRADVAAGNSQRAEILALVREYVGAGSAPSYTEYLTQIEAHTANLAANTNAILSELRSIITPESGLPAVRVQTA